MLTAAIIAITITGGTDLELFGKRISIHSEANLLTVAYAVFFLRVWLWYRRTGRARIAQSPRTRALWFWHVCPVAIWFLWPQKLGAFLWVNDPATNTGAHPQHSLWSGYTYYWGCLTHDYHVGAWSVLAVLTLTAVAVVAAGQKRLRPGATGILWFALVAAVLTAHHPYHASRFLHSWLPAVWVCAGIGAACLVRRPVFALLLGALAAALLPALVAPAHAPEGGIHQGAPSILAVTDAYLPALANSRRAAVLSNVPMKFLAQWTYLQRYGRAQRLETNITDVQDCDTVVYVDFPPGTMFYVPAPDAGATAQYSTLLARLPSFMLRQRITLPEYGCTITLWRRIP